MKQIKNNCSHFTVLNKKANPIGFTVCKALRDVPYTIFTLFPLVREEGVKHPPLLYI